MLKRIDPSPIAAILLLAHLAALVFGLVGLLYVLPNLAKFASDPNALRVYDWSMKYAGATHIIFGAAAMFAWSWRFLGARRTLIFAIAAYGISLTSELIGTGTGWPFGNYAYTSFLGWKVLGHVPYTIPMSWFYMGLASYMIGSVVAEHLGRQRGVMVPALLGAWFLTVWDLVLDPAMAHSSLRVQFWVWHQHGAYFEMPIRNLVGWTLTGLIFIVVSRLLWGSSISSTKGMGPVPLVVYVANLLFAMAVSADVGLWIPIVLSAILGLIPAAVIMRNALSIGVSSRLTTSDA